MGLHIAIDGRALVDQHPGIGRYLWNLLWALAPMASEERLTVLQSEDGAEANTRYPLDELEAVGIRRLEIPAKAGGLREQLSAPRWLRELEADVLHTPHYATSDRPPCPMVFTIFDVIGSLDDSFLPAASDRRAYRKAMQQAVRSAAGLLTFSKLGKDGLVEHFDADPKRVMVTPPAVDSRFAPAADGDVDGLRSRLGLPERYVLHLGTNAPHKNLVRLVQAWGLVRARQKAEQKDPRWELVLAGRHDPRYPEAREAARELGLSGVHFLGEVAEDDLAALYSGAGVFVLPSLAEGFGLPVLEAMACGTVVACSRSANVPPVAGAAAAYFDPGEVDSIAAALTRLLANGGYRQMLADRGAKHAAQYSWEKTARQTLRFYRRMAGD